VTAPGTNWETKEWRREAFAEVARHFQPPLKAISGLQKFSPILSKIRWYYTRMPSAAL
jgi:hypothetical protein